MKQLKKNFELKEMREKPAINKISDQIMKEKYQSSFRLK